MINYGNLVNDNIVCIDEDIYYSNLTSDDGKLYMRSLNLDKKIKLCDIPDVKYITKKENYIYYTSAANIYKLNLDTLHNEAIFSGSEDYGWIDDMSIVRNEMFFSLENTYKMNLNTQEIKKIAENAFGINIYNNKMYYSLNEGNGLYELDLQTNKSQKLSDSKTSCPVIYGDFVYYMDVDEKAFHKMHLFNYEKEKVTDLDEDLLNFNLYDKYIYYSDMYLFRIDIKSNKIEKISDIEAEKINIFDDQIWFVSYEDEFKLYKMDLKGKDLILID